MSDKEPFVLAPPVVKIKSYAPYTQRPQRMASLRACVRVRVWPRVHFTHQFTFALIDRQRQRNLTAKCLEALMLILATANGRQPLTGEESGRLKLKFEGLDGSPW